MKRFSWLFIPSAFIYFGVAVSANAASSSSQDVVSRVESQVNINQSIVLVEEGQTVVSRNSSVAVSVDSSDDGDSTPASLREGYNQKTASSSAFGQKYSNALDRYQNSLKSLSVAREALKLDNSQRVQNQLLASAKVWLSASLQSFITTLEVWREKISADQQVSQENKSALLSGINLQISLLESKSSLIDEAVTMEQLRQIRQDMIKNRQELHQLFKRWPVLLFVYRHQKYQEHFNILINRVEQKLSSSSIYGTDEGMAIQANIDQARFAWQKANDYLFKAREAAEAGEDASQFVSLAKASFLSAHNYLRLALESLKTLESPAAPAYEQ